MTRDMLRRNVAELHRIRSGFATDLRSINCTMEVQRCVWRFDRFARSVSHLLRALETFKALGIDFVSYSEQMDTSTPAGKMIFTVLGAVAELERSLIVERVKAGLRNARAKSKRIGRPASDVDASQIARLRTSNTSWREVGRRLGVSARTARRAHSGRGKTYRLRQPQVPLIECQIQAI
jgi:DNA invertase Pin-like site-specific DNA recombinase